MCVSGSMWTLGVNGKQGEGKEGGGVRKAGSAGVLDHILRAVSGV